MTSTAPHVTAAADQAVAAARSADAEDIERVLVKLVRGWYDTRPPVVADRDAEALAWLLATSADQSPPVADEGTWYERVVPALYTSYARAGDYDGAHLLWRGLRLTPRLQDRHSQALASIRLVQTIAALARCHAN